MSLQNYAVRKYSFNKGIYLHGSTEIYGIRIVDISNSITKLKT